MGWPKFEVDEHGTHFTVLLFDEYVIKVRRRKKKDVRKYDVKEIVEIQNELAEHLEEILPCERISRGCIVMPRIYGTPGRRLIKGHKRQAENLLTELQNKVRSLGFVPNDINLENIIYRDGKIYLIDCHRIERVSYED